MGAERGVGVHADGSGDEFDVVFTAAGAYIRGFDDESPMSPYGNDEPWPGVLDAVRHLYEERPVTAEVVTALNPGTEPTKMIGRIAEAGYPTS